MFTKIKLAITISGALFGLTWGASLRAWMTLLALEFGDRPHFSWQGTFLAILLPAMIAGILIGASIAFSNPGNASRWQWAGLSPLLLAIIPAIILPDFLPTLLETGLGGGAIAVALLGTAGGFAFSGRGKLWIRVPVGLFPVVIIGGAMLYALYFSENPMRQLQDAGVVFSALYFALLMLMLSAGAAIPYRVSLASPAEAPDV